MSTTKNNKVSVIVVNFNSTLSLNKLLGSLYIIDEIISEIIVIDNNSNDLKYFHYTNKPKVRIIKNKTNVGFASAVNQGIHISKNEVCLLLNPDCHIIDNSPIKTFELINNNNEIGLVGGKIINTSTNKTQFSATSKPNFLTGLFEFTNLKKIFPNNRYSKRFWLENNKITRPTKVFSLCGAYLFIRKIGVLLNEKYFLYLEDLDLGNIIEKAGYEAWFDPNSSIYHVGGNSNNSKYHTVLKHWYKSRIIYFNDNQNAVKGRILNIIFVLEELILKTYHYITFSANE